MEVLWNICDRFLSLPIKVEAFIENISIYSDVYGYNSCRRKYTIMQHSRTFLFEFKTIRIELRTEHSRIKTFDLKLKKSTTVQEEDESPIVRAPFTHHLPARRFRSDNTDLNPNETGRKPESAKSTVYRSDLISLPSEDRKKTMKMPLVSFLFLLG